MRARGGVAGRVREGRAGCSGWCHACSRAAVAALELRGPVARCVGVAVAVDVVRGRRLVASGVVSLVHAVVIGSHSLACGACVDDVVRGASVVVV